MFFRRKLKIDKKILNYIINIFINILMEVKKPILSSTSLPYRFAIKTKQLIPIRLEHEVDMACALYSLFSKWHYY